MTLVEFLLARIAEDETAAERGRRHNARETYANDNYGYLLVDPARVLAECGAKRQIIEDYEVLHADYRVTHDQTTEARRFQALVAIGRLAAAYSDHPDYDETWRP